MKMVLISNECVWRFVMHFGGTYPKRRGVGKGGIVLYEIGYFPQNNKHLKKIGFQSWTHFITDRHGPIDTN